MCRRSFHFGVQLLAERSHYMASNWDWIYHFHLKMPAYGSSPPTRQVCGCLRWLPCAVTAFPARVGSGSICREYLAGIKLRPISTSQARICGASTQFQIYQGQSLAFELHSVGTMSALERKLAECCVEKDGSCTSIFLHWLLFTFPLHWFLFLPLHA